MIAVDTNIMVYAHREDAPLHATAFECLRSLVEGRAAWGIPWPCVHEFIGIVTHTRIYNPPTSMRLAVEAVGSWMESPTLVLLGETTEHWPRLTRLLINGRVAGPRVHDARVAALCLQHGVRELWTADRDFSRFPDLATRNPLVG